MSGKGKTTVPTSNLRDYFAALAMQAMTSDAASHNQSIPDEMEAIAKLAYQQADAMLAAR